MNWNIVSDHWAQYEVEVKAHWEKLTEDHLNAISGHRGKLSGKLQEAYGISEEEAEEQIQRFEDGYSSKSS